MKVRIDYNHWLLATDLAIVTTWAVCTCWCLEHSSLAVIAAVPLIFMRLTMSFALYRHEKNALWLVGASAVILCFLFAILGGDALTILTAPMAKFVETLWRFFTHDNSLMHGAYQLLTHPREEGIESFGIWENVAIWTLSAWVYLAPIVWSGVLIYTKSFERVKWPWKRLLKDVADSFVVLPVVIPILVGLVMPKWLSLIAMVLCSAIMIYIMCQKWDVAKWRESYWLYAFVIPANVCFWSSQFVVDFWRYVLVYLSFGLVIAGAAFYYIRKREPIKTLTFAVCLGLLIPFFSIGYNVLACTYAKRIGNFDEYPYSLRGLLLVEDEDGIGIRDRYGLVISTLYEEIEYMGQDAPYVKVMREGLWDIADLETHATFFGRDYSSIKPVEGNPRVWELKYDQDGYDYSIYFKAPKYYSRFNSEDWETATEPLRHALKMHLDYLPENVHKPEVLDEFLARMVRGVWAKDEQSSYADHYWQWTQAVTADINSLRP